MEMSPPRPKKPTPELPPDTFTQRWHAALKVFEAAADGLQLGHVPVKTSHDPLDVAFRKKVVTALENKDMEQVIQKAELAIPGAHLNSTELGKLQFAVQALMPAFLEEEKRLTQVVVVQGHPLNNPSAAHYLQALKTLIGVAKDIQRDLKQEITKARIAGSVDAETAAAYKKNAEENLKLIKGAVARAMVFIKDARAAQNQIKFFDDGIQKAARDITQQLGARDKLAKQGYKFDRAMPQHLFDTLSEWGNHGRKIGAAGGFNDFESEAAAFEKQVRAVGE